MKTPTLAALCVAALLSACGGKVPDCPVCYQDEWSRDPFPGQPKQHIKPTSPAELQRNGLDARAAIGTVVSASDVR